MVSGMRLVYTYLVECRGRSVSMSIRCTTFIFSLVCPCPNLPTEPSARVRATTAHCTPSPQFCSAFSMLHLTLLSGFVSSSVSMAKVSARSAPRFSSSSPEGSERVSISYQVCLPVQISWLVITVRAVNINPTCILTF
jgi:hypothetical protein